MKEFHDAIIENAILRLDGTRMTWCTMRGGTLLYGGGPHYGRDNCFDNVQVVLDGHAANTIKFLRLMIASGGETLVREMLYSEIPGENDE